MRTNFSRGEQVAGLIWLSLGALLSLFLEVIYLTARIPLANGASIAFPITIVIAAAFNVVLTRTARLWSDSTYIAAIPLIVWVLVFFALMLLVPITGDVIVGNNILSLFLFLAGMSGGVWPFLKQK
ncbi:hypothetical protein GWO69_03105 [Corynebacterium macginleyi]|uniref:Uncharacterized protein n=1 Tax=Corynebacterium macginleyi TaxID=38290 RepID=A0A3M0GC42_9CORY|nr:hypothetical protein [Corynebacterium macginleyi]MBK4156465.1 hypothetical protein [Corynebacterium macginleyi]MBK4160730.1 hypothetical protein [Corynebacterium macginleyi]MBK4179375.1 hypothetical protein [Corynebacterium macginleyi]MBK4183456.1 hypothetical protein [Corynebacterium macginleyi]RMB58659.1 hypothetical protein D9543_08140 [Corynebacterium macginleyi]